MFYTFQKYVTFTYPQVLVTTVLLVTVDVPLDQLSGVAEQDDARREGHDAVVTGDDRVEGADAVASLYRQPNVTH